MPNTYSQIIVQIVFAVKGRQNLISSNHREELEKYICGIIKNKKSKPLAIYCNPDHIHVLVGLHPSISISDITRDIKASSSRFIKEKAWIAGQFNWQDGYGAFTYSRSQLDTVVQYIYNQPIHHQKRTFREEYLELLNKNDVIFEDKYLFEWVE